MIIWPTPNFPPVNLWSVSRKSNMTTSVTIQVPEGVDYHVNVHLMSEQLGITTSTVYAGQERMFYIYRGVTMMLEELPDE